MIAAAELYKVDKGTLRFTLHAGQAQAWRSKARFTFVIAGTQSGKTSFIPIWLDREIREKGHGDYLAATATYDLFKLKFLPELRRYFVDMMGWKEDKSDRVFWRAYKPGMFDRIILRSASSEGGLESATIKGAALDECGQDEFRVGAWEAVQRRLSLSQGRVFGGTTPYNLGWLKQQVYDLWRKGNPDYKVIQFSSLMNPAFPPAEYNRQKALLASWKFEMFYNGNFTRPAGMIYGDFNDKHKIKPFDIPAEWPRWVGIDPGPNHTAVLWAAEDVAKKCLYFYREYLEGDRTTNEHCAAVLKLSEKERVVGWALGQKSEKQYRLDWQANSIPVQEPPIPEVEAGIDRVIELLKSYRIYIFDTLAGLLDQFGIYSRKVDDTGEPTTEIKDKETFHFLDAVRYLVLQYEGPALFYSGRY
jgi:hypothetical protein